MNNNSQQMYFFIYISKEREREAVRERQRENQPWQTTLRGFRDRKLGLREGKAGFFLTMVKGA